MGIAKTVPKNYLFIPFLGGGDREPLGGERAGAFFGGGGDLDIRRRGGGEGERSH